MVWEDINREDIYARHYNPATNTLGAEFSVITNGGVSTVGRVDIAVLNNGNFVVTSQRGDHIRYTIVDASGSIIASQQQIAGTGQGSETDSDADVVGLSGGALSSSGRTQMRT